MPGPVGLCPLRPDPRTGAHAAPLPTGSEQRKAYLYTLGSDVRIVEAQNNARLIPTVPAMEDYHDTASSFMVTL